MNAAVNPAAQSVVTSPTGTFAFTGDVRSQTRNSTAFEAHKNITDDSPSIKRVLSQDFSSLKNSIRGYIAPQTLP